MYAIETELGRFVADNEAETKKLLRKAKREKKKKEATDSMNRAKAKQNAELAAYRHMLLASECRTVSDPTIIYRSSASFPCRRGAFGDEILMVAFRDNGPCLSFRPDERITAVFVNVLGHVEIAWIERENGDVCAYAIGEHEDQANIAPMPNSITPEMFHD